MIVAIDGPAGSGKSTVSKRIAMDLQFAYIDTGAMYRAVALYAVWQGIDVGNEAAVAALLSDVDISFGNEGSKNVIFLNGKDVSESIRTLEISNYSSVVATYKSVRDWLLPIQRAFAEKHDCIMDGRDIGTTVFPNADVKIFLVADDRERAERRLKERNEPIAMLPQVLAEIKARDENDRKRKHSPLKQAKDAILLDTTGLSIEDVCVKIKKVVMEKSTLG